MQRALVQALMNDASGDVPAVPRVLRELATAPNLQAMLSLMIKNRAWSAAVAARSYRHVLGFDKYVLLKFGSGGQLRLHVWRPDRRRIEEHVHNHRFAFSSAVVLGELRNHLYRAAPDGEALLQLREVSRVEDPGWCFQDVGTARVRHQLTAGLTAGCSYAMAADLLHRTEATGDYTITLVLQHRVVRDWSYVFVPLTAGRFQTATRTGFTHAELHAEMRDVLDALDQPAAR
jgi:hypothetical protein